MMTDRFLEQIVPVLFADATPAASPLWVGVLGLSGMGMDHARAHVRRLSPSESVTLIAQDALRSYHPDYERLVRENPNQMRSATARASADWFAMSLEYARARRFSVLVESPLQGLQSALDIASTFHESGYLTHLVALGEASGDAEIGSVTAIGVDRLSIVPCRGDSSCDFANSGD